MEFTFYGKTEQRFREFRELLLYLHKNYFVAYVRIQNNDVYLADKCVGKVDTLPVDYKESYV